MIKQLRCWCWGADRAARCCVCRQLYSVPPRVRGLGGRAWTGLRYFVAGAAVTLLAFGLSGAPAARPALDVEALAGDPPHVPGTRLLCSGGLLCLLHEHFMRRMAGIQGRPGRTWRCCCCCCWACGATACWRCWRLRWPASSPCCTLAACGRLLCCLRLMPCMVMRVGARNAWSWEEGEAAEG